MECENCKKLQKLLNESNRSLGYYKNSSGQYQRALSEAETKITTMQKNYSKLSTPANKLKALNYKVDQNIKKRKEQIQIEKELLDGLDRRDTTEA